jgi:diguanylate cyclase (GGDEF)-like protein
MTKEGTGGIFSPELLGGAPEAFVHTALLAAGIGLWEWPVADDGMTLSAYLEALLGYPPGGFDGTKRTFLDRLRPIDRPRFERAIASAIESGDECDPEFQLFDMHGGLRCFMAKGRVMRDADRTAIRIVGTMQEIPASLLTERRMRRQQAALLSLVTEHGVDRPLSETFARITEVAGKTLDVERTSIWLFNDDRSKLVCRSLYRRSLGRQMAAAALDAQAFPAYVAALEQERAIDASDAQHDPRTRQLADGYLIPLGITSMLEATVRMDTGELVGVVCHEHVGPVREWLLDEKSFAGSIADIVTRALTQERQRTSISALARSEERYRTYVSISTEAILEAEFDPPIATALPLEQQVDEITQRAVIVSGNAALARMFSAESAAALRGRAVAALMDERATRRIATELVRSAYRLSEHEFEIPTLDGGSRWVLGSSVGVVKDGQLTALWSTWRDISRRKAALATLEHQARHDPLTGLPNRTWLAERLGVRIDEARAKGERVALLLMDLDHFKEINDGLGHYAGDQLLKLIGPRLAPLLERTQGEIARLGGDEFAVIMRGTADDGELLANAAELVVTLREPFQVGMMQLGIDASVGVAVFPADGGDGSTLLRCADIAMYEAKRKGVRVELYSPSLDRYTPRRLTLANALGADIRIGRIEVLYQPIIGLRERRLEALEALARWEHPEHGVVAPEEFIALAEMGDQIRQLTLHVFEESARQWNAWQAAGLSVTISINLSTRVLMDESFARDAAAILRRHEMPGRCVHFEITENVMLTDPGRALETMRDLNELGICFSVDDFGIGFSSLSSLKQLPLVSLKVDRSFISQMTTSDRDASIVRSTINLAHDLGLHVIAEGVEDAGALAMITQMGCDQVQGNLIAPPTAGASVVQWARTNGW